MVGTLANVKLLHVEVWQKHHKSVSLIIDQKIFATVRKGSFHNM